jgi:hypothetical protein
VDGQTLSAPLEVRPDPRLTVPAADLEAQLRFALALRDEVSRLTGIVDQVRSVREQVRALKPRLGRDARTAPLTNLGDELIRKCDALEQRLHNPAAEVTYDILAMKGGARLYSKLVPLYSWAAEGDGAPTQGMREMQAEHTRELTQLEDEWKGLVAGDLAEINRKARDLGLELVSY